MWPQCPLEALRVRRTEYNGICRENLGYRPGTFSYRYLPADTGARFVAGEHHIGSISVLSSTGNVCFNPFDTAELVVCEAQLVHFGGGGGLSFQRGNE